jgi:hypothetical protein
VIRRNFGPDSLWKARVFQFDFTGEINAGPQAARRIIEQNLAKKQRENQIRSWE